MFQVLLVVAILAAIAGFVLCYLVGSSSGRWIAGAVAAGTIFITLSLIGLAFETSQGKMYFQKLKTSTKNSYWLIVDNSGGKTMRCFIYYGYVQSSDQSDGWQFKDYTYRGMEYVSGDAYVKQIHPNEFESFMYSDWRNIYNIPSDLAIIPVSVDPIRLETIKSRLKLNSLEHQEE